MVERGNAELVFAIVITIVVMIGMVLIGLGRVSPISDAIAPLIPTQDHAMLLQEGIDPGTNANLISTVAAPAKVEGTKASATMTPIANANGIATPIATVAQVSAKTPTPIRVTVNTQKRSWVYYHGPATYVRSDAFAPLPLSSFPRPTNDNGRGLHWFPTTYQTRAVVDRFVPELLTMQVRWLVVLQGMDDWNMIANDYLIDQLLKAGIMPIVRIDRQVGEMNWARLGWIVARYRERGVRYFQIFNEPNAPEEWNTGGGCTPERFVAYWIQAADVVAANGGYPGFAPMSPQGDDSDLVFFQAALEELKRLKRFDLANLMWVSVHNYGGFDPGHPTDDGFFRYRAYDTIVRKVFGASLPLIITEGGPGDAEALANMIAPMYQFVTTNREPYLLAFAPWLIGNAVGGGHDSRWEPAAWFTGTLSQMRERNVVAQAKAQ
jgi:hypothetical protein